MKNITNAFSKNDGIIFQSTMTPELSVEATRDEKGEIHVIILPSIIVEALEFYEAFQIEELNKSFRRLVWGFDLILVGNSFFTNNIGFILASIFFSIMLSQDLFGFIKFAYKMKAGTKRQTAKYHSAEHMAVNAHRKLHRVPTLEEIRFYSRFCKQCGSRIAIYKIVIYGTTCLLLSILNITPLYIYLPLSLVIITFVLVGCFQGWLIFLQIFVTNKPSDSELEVAIKGLEVLQKLDNSIESGEFDMFIRFVL